MLVALRRATSLALCVAAVGALATSRDAAASSQTRLRVDRVIAEPAWLPGMTRLRVYATAVTLSGAFVPVSDFALKIGASKKKLPYLTGMYGGTGDVLSIGLVVLVGNDFADDFPEIQRELGKLLDSLPKDAKVALVSYSDTIHATPRLAPAAAKRKLERLFPDTAPSENELIKAVSRAVGIVHRIKLKPPETSARKMVIVVSDGKDLDFDPARFKKAGNEAARHDVRIHSLAFSPEDNRRPLLGLGELSKRSLGTFRWVRQSGLFAGQIKPLADEIAEQYVLTFFVATGDVDKKRIALVAGDVESNHVKVKVGCGSETCGSDQYCAGGVCVTRGAAAGGSILSWVVYIIGGLIGLFLLLGGIGFLISRSRPRQAPIPPPVDGQQAESSHRIPAVDGGPPHRIQPAAPSTQQPAQPAQPASRAVLYVVKGPGAGQSLPVTHGFTIGSQPGLHLSLVGDRHASSVHAQILMDTAGNCTIVDKGSTNGTFVNGVRAPSMRLTHGMSITVGAAELRFLIQ